MKRITAVVLFLIFSFQIHAQDKRGYTWITGATGMFVKFSDTSRPTTGLFNTAQNKYVVFDSHSVVCDSITGNLLFYNQGYRLWNYLGNKIENGDSLVPNKIYGYNAYPDGQAPQGSLILPKGSQGLYYVFTPTMNDTFYDKQFTDPFYADKTPFNLLQYHIVDMNANNGEGRVIQKNIPLLENVHLSKTGMQACRHANGVDWWLLKQGSDSNIVYSFLVTADTVLDKDTMRFDKPVFRWWDRHGQSCFNTKGNKYANASGDGKSQGAQLVISDFNRCTGKLNNPKVLKIPYDLSLTPLDTFFGPYFDSIIVGVCFSPNDSFLYVARRYNIYQYALFEPDSSKAVTLIQNGPDTTFQEFSEYGTIQPGPDGRLYIGKQDAGGKHNSVIDYPNRAGHACGFCKRCLRFDGLPGSSSSMPNMPNYNMKADSSSCWPVGIKKVLAKTEVKVMVFPNPAQDKVTFSVNTQSGAEIFIYNTLGIHVGKAGIDKGNNTVTISTQHFSPGLYTYRMYVANRIYTGKLTILK